MKTTVKNTGNTDAILAVVTGLIILFAVFFVEKGVREHRDFMKGCTGTAQECAIIWRDIRRAK